MSWITARKSLLQRQAEAARVEQEGKRHEAIVTALNSITGELQNEHQSLQTADAAKEFREWLNVWGMFATAIAALIGLSISIWIGVNQHYDTIAALERADRANQIAERTASTQYETTRDQLRAYLGFNPGAENGIGYQCPFSNLKKKSINDCQPNRDSLHVQLKNFGQTPAIKIRGCNFFQHAKTPEAYDVKSAFQYLMEKCDTNSWALKTIWPGESAPYTAFFTADSIDALQRSARGDGVTFFVVWISYSDKFGTPHNSYLCERFNGKFESPGAVIDCGGAAPTDD